MLSPEATRDVAARPAPSAGERELKFILPAGRAHLARRRLESVCRRDPEFPAAVVWTIYYDTPALVSLGEKINSDYLKRKIRVRWYSDLEGRVSGPAFVEAKFRMGTRRSKVRARLPYPADEIARLGSPGSAAAELPAAVARAGRSPSRVVAADDADSLSPRSIHRAAHRFAREPRCRYFRHPRRIRGLSPRRSVAAGDRCARSEGQRRRTARRAAPASGARPAQALVLEVSGRLRAHDAPACCRGI